MNFSSTCSPTTHEMEQLYSLRQQSYLESLNIKTERTDNWDKFAHRFLVKQEGTVIGGARLTISSTNYLLPVEDEQIDLPKYFSLGELGTYGELTQFVAHPNFRTGDVSLTIFKEIERFCFDHLIEHIVFKSSKTISRLHAVTLSRLNKLHNKNHTLQVAAGFQPSSKIIERYTKQTDTLCLINVDTTNNRSNNQKPRHHV